MSHFFEQLEPRRLLSASLTAGHRATHRIDVKTTQVAIDAKLVQTDLKDMRQLGLQWVAVQKKEVQQIGAMLHPLSTSNKQLLDNVLSALPIVKGLFKSITGAAAEDNKAVAGVRSAYILFLNHPGDSFAIGKFSSAIDTFSSTGGVLNGLLTETPGAQQQVTLNLGPIVNANSSIEIRVDAAIANINAKGQALSDKADQISNHTDQLLNDAEAALQ